MLFLVSAFDILGIIAWVEIYVDEASLIRLLLLCCTERIGCIRFETSCPRLILGRPVKLAGLLTHK